MGDRVQRVQTDVSEPQMAQAIIAAWTSMFGTPPSKEQVAMILAQNSLETGNRKAMWNFNVGNITTDGKGPYNYFDDLSTKEQVSPGVWKRMTLKYRAYPSLQAGVLDYLRLLSGKHYSQAWEHILHPDPVAFSKALKAAGYYTANEAPYTKGLISLFNQSVKSNSYEQAMEGKAQPSMLAVNAPGADVYSILDRYLQQVAASDRSNKKIYQKFLPNHDILIRIYAATETDAVEFARVLTTALDEELHASAFTHTNGCRVEVACQIAGPEEACFDTVKELTSALTEAFEVATKKIGGIKIKTDCVMDKRSSYQAIDLKTANSQYRKFLLKFIKG